MGLGEEARGGNGGEKEKGEGGEAAAEARRRKGKEERSGRCRRKQKGERRKRARAWLASNLCVLLWVGILRLSTSRLRRKDLILWLRGGEDGLREI
ncbi:hypothetical protein Droror1_Dr00010453 [Drosera rotundifolia]